MDEVVVEADALHAEAFGILGDLLGGYTGDIDIGSLSLGVRLSFIINPPLELRAMYL